MIIITTAIPIKGASRFDMSDKQQVAWVRKNKSRRIHDDNQLLLTPILENEPNHVRKFKSRR